MVNYKNELPNHLHLPPGVALGEEASEVIAPQVGDTTNRFNQQRAFLEAVQFGGEPFVSIQSGVNDLRVVAAVYESVRTGCAVAINRELAAQKQPDIATNAVVGIV